MLFRSTLNIEAEDPSIGKIADAIYEREKHRYKARTRPQVHDNTWPGFGCEIAFRRAIPRARILNEGVTDLSETTYVNLQRDIMLDDEYIAIKGLDRGGRYKTEVWISEKQRKSIEACAKFCKELVFMSYSPVKDRIYKFSTTGVITDLPAFARDFDKYAKKTGSSYSYEMNVSTAERRGIYIDLLQNSVYNHPTAV